jgi:CRISPR/Cas system-associated exonuclease Cas4 (RecB family)
MTADSGPFAHFKRALESPHSLPAEAGEPDDLLPGVFQFSQASLQDYVDCPRRFQLRYVIGQRWPAAQASPIEERERFMERGSEFHLLVQRHLSGVATETITPADPLLAEWWNAYLTYPPPDLPEETLLPEMILSTTVGDQRLVARFDLLAITPGERVVIVDWKTSRHPPGRARMADRMQTKIYPYVLIEAGEHLFGGPIKPEQVSLIYWFAQKPTHPFTFTYNVAQHESNRVEIAGVIKEIVARRDPIWTLTDDIEKQCAYCVYRSLCDRDVKAGDFAASQEEFGEADFDFDLDEIDEIAF